MKLKFITSAFLVAVATTGMSNIAMAKTGYNNFAVANTGTISKADLIQAKDIRQARGRYSVQVPGHGKIYIKAVRASGGKGDCQIHRPSLIKSLASRPKPAGQGPWISFDYVMMEGLGMVCMNEGGAGCYVLTTSHPTG